MPPSMRDQLQELRELGPAGTAFRVAWELRLRSGLARHDPTPAPDPAPAIAWRERLPWAHPTDVAAALEGSLPKTTRRDLAAVADRATRGVIRCFSRWDGDYGDPFDWHRNPVSGERWNPSLHWSEVLRDAPRVGDVKLAWEAARFPQAYHLARAATFDAPMRDACWTAFDAQVRGFLAASPFPLGIHWFSNQEATIRLHAWLFALSVFAGLGCDTASLAAEVSRNAAVVAGHTLRELPYAQRAVYNNHLVAEAFGLWTIAWMRPELPDATEWSATGRRILDDEAAKQFYGDGAYLNLSHTYHRVVVQDYLLAARFARADGAATMPAPWARALERSLDFLVAHQDPATGALPNHGANDGSLPRVLSTCAYEDFRPALQALSLAVRGERLYEPGPWDEEAAWLLGPRALEAPLRAPGRRSVSFAETGYHVLRSATDEGAFAAFRCGSMRDRFGQMDMLHVDAWWGGANVLADGGTYLYNAEHRWHDHFLRSESHNTVTVDGREQMLHFRRFKFLYWTRARLLRFGRDGDGTVAVGEHDGFARHPGGCVHRRSVRLFDDGVLVVVDRVRGEGTHTARLHWLGGAMPFTADADRGAMVLHAPKGDVRVAVYDRFGASRAGTVVCGRDDPPRGWIARSYAVKEPAPSLAVEGSGDGDIVFVTIAGPADLAVAVDGATWTLRTAQRTRRAALLEDVAP